MKSPPLILIVDDNPTNIDILQARLTAHNYQIITATDGESGLAMAREQQPDLILLDIMMPKMDGIEVCCRLRADPSLPFMPIIMVTAKADSKDVVAGLEAGGDEYLIKPVDHAALVARVKSMLRIKDLHDTVCNQAARLEAQSAQLSEWNRTLELRVAEGVRQIGQMSQLKRFLSPQIADLIVNGATDDPLKSHRREITVVFLDLRGFTAFTETADPEEVMGVLQEYHNQMGRKIMAHNGTIEHFAGDGIMIVFNDPVVIDNPAWEAVNMSIQMQADFACLSQKWKRRGYELQMGIGIAQGYATIGVIGFEGRCDYNAIGIVCNLASRLCGEAKAGQILVSQKVFSFVEDLVRAEPAGDLNLKGFHKPIPAFNVTGLK